MQNIFCGRCLNLPKKGYHFILICTFFAMFIIFDNFEVIRNNNCRWCNSESKKSINSVGAREKNVQKFQYHGSKKPFFLGPYFILSQVLWIIVCLILPQNYFGIVRKLLQKNSTSSNYLRKYRREIHFYKFKDVRFSEKYG